jgi:amino acid transporter
VTGIAVLASGLTSASALATAFGGQYFQTLVDAPQLLVSLLFIAVVAFINLRGISESVRVNMVLTLIEVAGLIAIVLIAAKIVVSGDGEPARALDFASGDNVFLLVLSGAALAFYSFVGFEDTANLAEEVKDPSQCYPRALFTGLGIAGGLYLAVTALSSMAVDTGRLAGSDGPLLEVVRIGGGLPIKLFAVIGLLAVANGALINMVMASRLLYGMGRERLVPGVFSRVLTTRRTPWVAIVFTTALAGALIATGSIADLAATTSLLLVCVFILVNGAVLLLRNDAEVVHDHFHVPSVVPVAGIVVCAALLTQQPADAFVRAAVLVAAGIGLWLLSHAGSWLGRRGSGSEPTGS